MPFATVKWYTRQMIRANPDWLFVFGDNFERWGRAGQAREARDEPNAVGIATKRAPYDFLKDDDLVEWEFREAKAWIRIFDHLDNGGTVVWPEDGIGSGLAKLDEKAPKIAAAIELRLSKMKEYNT